MVTIDVAALLDDEGDEVLLEISNNNIKLYAFCYPFISKRSKQDKVTLYALFASNIGPSKSIQPPIRTNTSYFSQRIYAKVVDVKERCVRLRDINIILDTPIDSSFLPGSVIVFDVARLDYDDR